MLLGINDNKTISDLQDKFSECFPGFKIEFFSKPYQNGSSKQQPLDERMWLSEIRHNHEHGIMDIKSWNKADEVVLHFKTQFGLNVQVYYNKNNTWLPAPGDHDFRLQQV